MVTRYSLDDNGPIQPAPTRGSFQMEERRGYSGIAGVGSHIGSPTLPAPIDADTTDFYDDAGGIPPPHRLSTAYSHSPYPGSQDHIPPAPPRPSSTAYADPFSSPYASPRQSMNMASPYPNLDSRGSFQYGGAPNSNDGRYNYGYTAPAAATSQDDLHDAHDMDADAWGVPQAASGDNWSNSRDRYLARKEAGTTYASVGANDVYGNARPAGRSRMKWWIIGGALVAVAIIAVAIGISVSKSKKGGNSSSSSSGDGKSSNGVVKSDPNDPSVFTKDPNLHQSFYGLCYTPLNAQYPACGDGLDAVIEDIQLISQLTNRIRLYGSDCQQAEFVLQAINETKVDMQVWLAVWVDGNATTYARQVQEVTSAIAKFGADHVGGVTVGNEYLLNGGTVVELAEKMADMRATLGGMGLSKTIPVGTADAGSMITTALAQASDYVMSNVHPWFGGVPVTQAAGWTWDYFENNTPATAKLATNSPQLYIAETGWPTGANATAFLAESPGSPAIAGIPELQTFLDTFVCTANTNATQYFFFEAFDEPWKDVEFGGVEAYWGLFGSDKKLKQGLTLPNCAHP